MAGAARDLRFDLVTATVDRTAPLEALLASLENQTHTAFRLVVVDQNADDRVPALLHAHPQLEVLHLRSQRGLSRARNAALPHLDADLVAFPDDDCVYGPDLLARVAERFATDGDLDGLTGRAVDPDGTADPSWRERHRGPRPLEPLEPGDLVHDLPAPAVVAGVGPFDERLGLGSGTPWSSGEEVDYVLRAIRSGARIVYDPAVTVTHARKRYTSSELRAVGLRDGASVGWMLRRHGYGVRTTARMLLRPVGGIGASLVRGDLTRASLSRRNAARARARLRRRAVLLRHELAEDRRVAVEPVGEREPLDGAAPRCRRVALPVGEDRADRRGEILRRGRPVPVERVVVRDADPALVADELDGAAARRVGDRDAAGQRLDHRGRARVVHLRVEEDVRAADQRGRVCLRVPPRRSSTAPCRRQAAHRRLRVGDEPAG